MIAFIVGVQEAIHEKELGGKMSSKEEKLGGSPSAVAGEWISGGVTE
jgi:hypothetical protein